METYDYYNTVKEDVKEYIRLNYENPTNNDWEQIYDECMLRDDVTGNASGSYTFNAYEAEKNLCHNNYLIVLAADEFGYTDVPREWLESAETADVIIRCYMLGQVLQEAIDEIMIEREN